MQIPTAWNEVESGTWSKDEEEAGPYLYAATYPTGLHDYWDAAGVWFGASSILTGW